MSASDNTSPESGPENVDEFLGEKTRPRWRRWMKFWLPAVVIIMLVLSIYSCSSGDSGPTYITEEVERGSLDLTVTATGNLRPTNQVTVGSEVNGPVERVLVDVNDRVTRGQVIAVINTEIVDQQIAQSRANLNAARASLTQARATLDVDTAQLESCLLYTSPSPRDRQKSRMPSSA